jgi:prefoldin subunit 5
MPDTELDILIRLLAETKGGDAVQASLNKTKDATTDLGKATEDLGEKTKEGAKHAEKFELSHRAIHQILHLISHEAGPEFGTAVSGAMAAGTGGVLILIMAVRELFEWLHKAREAASELRQEAADMQVNIWESQRQAMADAANAAQDYRDALHDIASISNTIKAEDDRRMAVLNAQIAAIAKLLEYQEKQALIAAKGDAAEEARVRELFEGKKSSAEESGEVAKIVEMRRAQEELAQNADLAKRRFEAAHSALTAAKANDEALRAQSEIQVLKNKAKGGENDLQNQLYAATHETDYDAAKAKVEEMRRAYESSSANIMPQGISGSPVMGANESAAVGGAYAKAKDALTAVEEIKAKLDRLTKSISDHDTSLKELTKAETDAKKEMDALADRTRTAKEALETAEAVYSVKANEAHAEGKTPPGIPPGSAKTGSPPPSVGEVWKNLQHTEDSLYQMLSSGQTMTAQQAAVARQILELQTGHRYQNSQILDALRIIYTDQNAFKAAMERELKALQHARDQAGY